MSKVKVKAVAKKARKPARKRDASRLVPETLFGRLVNFTPVGLAHFDSEKVRYNDALRWHLAHPRVKKKKFKKKFGLSSRVANTIIRQVKGMKQSIAENLQNRIADTKAHIAKSEQKQAKLVAVGKRTGSIRDRIKRLKEKLVCQKKQVGKASIFFGREAYRNQPVAANYTSPAEFALAYSKFRKEFESARYGQFGCIGSHDEEYGNRTYQLRADFAVKDGSYYHVSLWHSREKLADLRFSDEDYNQLVSYQATKEAVTVKFLRNRNHWIGHIGLMTEGPEPYTPSAYILATDVNADCLSWVLFKLSEGKLTISKYGELPIPIGSTAKRESALRKGMRVLTSMAKIYGAVMAFENLNLRKKKAKDNGARMNEVLHGLPYAKVMAISSRMCILKGIPVRYVNPGYTSIVGGVFTAEFPELNRDQGACLPIGLLATDVGKAYLDTLSRQMLDSGGKYRTSVKGKNNLTAVLQPVKTGPSNSSVGGGVRQRTAHSRTNLDDFYLLGKQLKRMTETLYQLAPKSKRSGIKPGRECHWNATVRVKSPERGRVMRELAAGSLNVLNPANFWLRQTPVSTGVPASTQL